LKKIEIIHSDGTNKKSYFGGFSTELVFHLNDNVKKDSLPPDLQVRLEAILETCLDDLCIYYNDMLKVLDQRIKKKFPFLEITNQKIWLISKIFSKDIESSGSVVRLVAYLDFLLRISSQFEVVVKTDNKLFYKMLIANQIKCEFRGKRKVDVSFFKVLMTNFVISKKFKKKKSAHHIMFLSLSSNWNKGIGDRHYGRLANLKTEFGYVHFLTTTKHFFKYSSTSDVVLNSHLKFFDFIQISYEAIRLYVKLRSASELSFNFKSMSLSVWVNTLLREMFFNEFLSSSIYNRAIANYFKSTNRDNLILLTYGELFSTNILLYSRLRQLEKIPSIIAVQHAVNFQRKLSNHETLNHDKSSLPDLYLIHGQHFNNFLSSYNLNMKRKIIGCLKYEGIKFEDQVDYGGIKKILIAPSLNDFHSIMKNIHELPRTCYEKYEFYISVHPAFDSSELLHELSMLDFPVHVVKNISTLEFAKQCDAILFSYSSIGLEALFFKKKIIRIYSRKLPKLFDEDSRIPTVFSGAQLEKELAAASEIPAKELIEYYFGFLDGNVNNRLDLVLSSFK